MVVLRVHVVALWHLAVGVELAGRHAVQRASLGLVSLGNGRARRGLVVARSVHYMRARLGRPGERFGVREQEN